MTTELQRAKARYEEARIEYKRAVLASLNGDATGEAIRDAIRSFQAASGELRRITGAPRRAAPPVSPLPANDRTDDAEPFGFRFVRRLLTAG